VDQGSVVEVLEAKPPGLGELAKDLAVCHCSLLQGRGRRCSEFARCYRTGVRSINPTVGISDLPQVASSTCIAEQALPPGLGVETFSREQQNTNTRRLTEEMLDAVFLRAQQLLGGVRNRV
jgi:hypothetical protein